MKIGKIVSVEYDKFRVRLFATTKHSTVSINGQVYRVSSSMFQY